jgi:predicted transcriptional regulator
VAQVDSSESKAIESIENLLYNLTKKDIKVPEELLENSNFTVVVEKIDGEYNVKFEDNND